jgi:hypothetical protein
MYFSAAGFIIFLTLCAFVALMVLLIRRLARPENTADWPVTEGTIQSVRTVVTRAERIPGSMNIGDFFYTVNDEYHSGRVTFSRSFSTHDHSPEELIDQKIQVRYNPRKPDRFSVQQAELGGFLVDPYDEAFGQDIGSIDLNID